MNRVSAALGRNCNTRVEDQSHAGGVSGSRWLLTAASRLRPNSPSSVVFEPRSFARRSDSDSSRAFGAAGRSTATASAFRSITTSAPARTRARRERKSFAAFGLRHANRRLAHRLHCKTSVQLQSTSAQTPPKTERYQRPESKTIQQLPEPSEICKTSTPGSNPGGASNLRA